MAERSNAAVLKTVDCHRSGGSNPSLSATLLKKPVDQIFTGFFYTCPSLFSPLDLSYLKIVAKMFIVPYATIFVIFRTIRKKHCMKLKFFLFLLVVFISIISTLANAQVKDIVNSLKPKKKFEGTPILEKRSRVISFGIGTPNKLANFLDLGGLGSLFSSSKSHSGPYFVNYEFLIRKDLGLGATVSYASAKQTYQNPFGNDKITGSISGFSILFSSTYHFYITDKLDPYLRGGIGVNIWTGSYKDENNGDAGKFTAPTPIAYTANLGLRYFLSPKVAPFGELGFSNYKLTANIGLAVKLR